MASRVTRREFINSAAATGALVAGARIGLSSQAQRPNVLFILADDLGYGDLSCYGRPDYQTPVLDALARQGVKFTSAYAAAPVCTPTRCAFVTGRYPQRIEVGLHEPLTGARSRQGTSGGPADDRLAPEGQWIRHRPHRQVAPRVEAGIRTEPAWVR